LLSLLRLLDSTASVQKPAAALKCLNRNLKQPSWVAVAQQEWSLTTRWSDTVINLGTVVSVATALTTLIPRACGL
jgi:hypothetical protein